MFPKINPTTTPAWQSLQTHYEEMRNVHMKDLFREDANRFKKYSLCASDILFDYSKNIINDKTIELLLQLTQDCKLKDGIDATSEREPVSGSRLRPKHKASRGERIRTAKRKLHERKSSGGRRRDGPFHARGHVLRRYGHVCEADAGRVADRADNGCVDGLCRHAA